MKNIQIRENIKQSRFFYYQIAEQIGITESAFCKWFRKELTEEQETKVLRAITELKNEG